MCSFVCGRSAGNVVPPGAGTSKHSWFGVLSPTLQASLELPGCVRTWTSFVTLPRQFVIPSALTVFGPGQPLPNESRKTLELLLRKSQLVTVIGNVAFPRLNLNVQTSWPCTTIVAVVSRSISHGSCPWHSA